MDQKVIFSGDHYHSFDQWVLEEDCKRPLLVHDGSLYFQEELKSHLKKNLEKGIRIVYFNDFQPNPLYENVQSGVKLFREEKCDSIIAIGGGSAIDVAKCIKLYGNLSGDGSNGSWLKAEYVVNDIPFLAMPTTAGTGSEATRYAVIYYNGIKQSITSQSFIPKTVLMDPDCLKSLPLYQKKSTMMDALCHGIESFWSVNSNDESKEYSLKAIKGVLEHMEGYLNNTEEGRRGMLIAANMAGKAINITQTTAGHALCYKITSLFGCAHGHAAILCDRILFPWMIDNLDKCIDQRGANYLEKTLNEIGKAFSCECAKDASVKLNKIFEELRFEIPSATEEQFELLRDSVNPDRLKNHPIALNKNSINDLYHQILNGEDK